MYTSIKKLDTCLISLSMVLPVIDNHYLDKIHYFTRDIRGCLVIPYEFKEISLNFHFIKQFFYIMWFVLSWQTDIWSDWTYSGEGFLSGKATEIMLLKSLPHSTSPQKSSSLVCEQVTALVRFLCQGIFSNYNCCSSCTFRKWISDVLEIVHI